MGRRADDGPVAVATADGYLLRDGVATTMRDSVAEEVPVALTYNGVSHAVMMATPADLEAFALGFSLSEGILRHPDELHDIEVTKAPQGLVVYLTISARRFAALRERRRSLAGRTGCGLCGVDSLDQAVRPVPPLHRSRALATAAITRALADLPRWQALNRVTRSLHAAVFADADGAIVMAAEDVGRHNALDKLIGALALAKREPGEGFVVITSRCSFEMVQKAATAGVPLLVAISAPTALAVTTAQSANMTLVALARPDSMQVYSHPEFIDGAGLPPRLDATAAQDSRILTSS
ncbi:MAG: formate dehydrogenase accessory sulfurtransferase FdhD [Rhodopseudomonas sp.]|nr:formate dehydrogenase accessory sulfurtransferase FdhD [Rhodopseudomonas sp.]